MFLSVDFGCRFKDKTTILCILISYVKVGMLDNMENIICYQFS